MCEGLAHISSISTALFHTSAKSPNDEKYSLIDSGVVCHERPPMNILPGSFGMSSPLE